MFDIQPGNDVFWDVQTKVSVDNRLELSTDESVIIQAASSDDFWEIWNELNVNKFIDIQSELEKINNWTITADNENIGEPEKVEHEKNNKYENKKEK